MIMVVCMGNSRECKTENEARRKAEIASRFDEAPAFVWVDGEMVAEYVDGEEVVLKHWTEVAEEQYYEDGDDDGCDVYAELYDDEIGYNPYMGCYDMDV